MMHALKVLAQSVPDPALYEVYGDMIDWIESMVRQASEAHYREEMLGYADAFRDMCHVLEERWRNEKAVTAEGLLVYELESLTNRKAALQSQLDVLRAGSQPDPLLAARLDRTRAALLEKLSDNDAVLDV
jgi:hypothetical protein